MRTKSFARPAKDVIKLINRIKCMLYKPSLIIQGEELYIKDYTYPKMSKKGLELLIEEEIIYNFKHRERIIFNYINTEKKADKQNIKLFCVYSERISSIPQIKKYKEILLIQLCFLQYCTKLINKRNYFFILYEGGYFYILGIVNNIIVGNETIKDNENIEGMTTLITNSLVKLSCENNESMEVFGVNLPKDLINNTFKNTNWNYLIIEKSKVLQRVSRRNSFCII